MRPFRGSQPHASIRILVTVALLLGIGIQMLPTPATAPDFPQTPQKSQAQSEGPLSQQGASTADSSTPAAIEGWVKATVSHQPVAGATVTLDHKTKTISDGNGYFRFEPEQVTSAIQEAPSTQKVTISVDAPGYASWSLNGARYFEGDTLRVYPRISASDKVASSLNTAADLQGASSARVQNERLLGGLQASLASFDSAPPATIRIYRTQTDEVEVVPFRDYLKHTLPNEWIPSWSPAALKAGAMAVKTYAWYWVVRGGKQAALGADLKDNIEDQVYDPNVSYASTDAAVDATYNYAMTRNGATFQAQYCAGTYDPDPTGDCPWSGSYMTQWGSAYYADQGRSWGWLIGFYYPGVAIAPAPPGGGYDGTPIPTKTLPTRQPIQPTSTSVPITTYVVGQGSNQADVFQEAYDRNGGQAVLGNPTGAVHWWMTYVSEDNVLAQPFSGSQGQGNMWLVFDVLKSAQQDTSPRAFMFSGDIAAAYESHTPTTGPEWVGAPTSDPYTASRTAGGFTSQGFVKGTLSWNGQSVNFTPWPDKVSDWKAEYFVGFEPTLAGVAPNHDLPGHPALVVNSLTPGFQWPAESNVPQSMGVGAGPWSVQFTKNVSLTGLTNGSYDFTLSANSGARLWVDGMLAINDWNRVDGGSDRYNADLDAGMHTVRVQYYNISATRAATLDLSFAPRSAATPTPLPTVEPLEKVKGDLAALRVRMTFLGRQTGQEGMAQPVTLYLSDPSTSRVLYAYTGKTDVNGVAYFGDLPSGPFNVHVKSAQSLQSARANIALSDNTVADVDMKSLIMGDLDGDNCVTVDDFSIVQTMLGASRSTPGFNPAADLNGDGVVTMSDVSLLRAGFDRCGDISADALAAGGDFSAMSTDGVPVSTLAQMLLPWTQPERLDHTLSLRMAASRTSAKRGDTVEVQVVAESGTQPVDGASFIVSYDPKRLKPVDASGKEADGYEPGFALPAVMGNWIDKKGGFAGYSAGILQGSPPQGSLQVATLRFQVLPGATGTTRVDFVAINSPNMQVTNGGANLLAHATGLDLTVSP